MTLFENIHKHTQTGIYAERAEHMRGTNESAEPEKTNKLHVQVDKTRVHRLDSAFQS